MGLAARKLSDKIIDFPKKNLKKKTAPKKAKKKDAIGRDMTKSRRPKGLYREDIVQVWNAEGMRVKPSVSTVAKIFGCSPTNISIHLEKAVEEGLPVRRVPHRLNNTLSELIRHPNRIHASEDDRRQPLTILQLIVLKLLLREPSHRMAVGTAAVFWTNTIKSLLARDLIKVVTIRTEKFFELTDSGQIAAQQYVPLDILLADPD